MRIAELSGTSGVPVATIKYYLREGLLPPGERSSPNQAQYDEQHLRRLRLVRALVNTGNLPITTVREILRAIDAPDTPPHEVFGLVQEEMTPRRDPADDVDSDPAHRHVAELVAARGWRASAESPVGNFVASVIRTAEEIGHADVRGLVDTYADAAEKIADADVDQLAGITDREALVERMAVTMALGDTLLLGLRRLAQEDRSARRFDR